jgi:hypothetical protein
LFGVVVVDTVAPPFAGAELTCVACPSSSPEPLATRIETSMLVGDCWVAVAFEVPVPCAGLVEPAAPGCVEASGHVSPHCARLWTIELSLSTWEALFAAFGSGNVPRAGATVAGSASAEVADALLSWVRGASLPGLPTRTDTLRFAGATWVEVDVAEGPVPVPEPTDGFPAATAVAVEVFRWSTGPLSPGLLTRTVRLRFVGWTCVELAFAVPESADDVAEGAEPTVNLGPESAVF